MRRLIVPIPLQHDQDTDGLALVAGRTWATYAVLYVNSLIEGVLYVLLVLQIAAKWDLSE